MTSQAAPGVVPGRVVRMGDWILEVVDRCGRFALLAGATARAALRPRFPVLETRALGNPSDRPRGKPGGAAETGTHGRAPERQLREGSHRRLDPRDSQLDLTRVSRKSLSETHRRRIHQVCPTNLDYVVELGRVLRETVAQSPQRREQVLVDRLTGGDVKRGRHHVVR